MAALKRALQLPPQYLSLRAAALLPRVQERCHPFHSYTRGLEDLTNASLQRGRQG